MTSIRVHFPLTYMETQLRKLSNDKAADKTSRVYENEAPADRKLIIECA